MNEISEKVRGRASGLKRSEQREMAKAGMIASLGTLVVTGFLRFRGAGMLHAWAGLFLVGFSVWHHLLNQPGKAGVSEKPGRDQAKKARGKRSPSPGTV